jgi:hypothetical protein
MGSLTVPRRQFLLGLASLGVCAPAVVRAPSLMGVSARFCWSSRAARPWTASQEALALLQHEMERRFTETLFGAENLSAEAEDYVMGQDPVVAEAKITELWQLRTLFGPRGSPPKALEDLPAEIRACLSSMFGTSPDASSGARGTRFPCFAARPNV